MVPRAVAMTDPPLGRDRRSAAERHPAVGRDGLLTHVPFVQKGCELHALQSAGAVAQNALCRWRLVDDSEYPAGTSITAEWRVRHGDGSWRRVEVVANNLLGDP